MHSVNAVHIAGSEVRIECSCGWKSETHPSETKATEEWEKHKEASDADSR